MRRMCFGWLGRMRKMMIIRRRMRMRMRLRMIRMRGMREMSGKRSGERSGGK